MSSKEETAAINARLAKAISERDSGKASGIQEKYLEAYTLVEALELLLEDSHNAGLADEAQKQAPEKIVPPDESELALMNSLAITFSKGRYFFGPYRYNRLADAVHYARLISR